MVLRTPVLRRTGLHWALLEQKHNTDDDTHDPISSFVLDVEAGLYCGSPLLSEVMREGTEVLKQRMIASRGWWHASLCDLHVPRLCPLLCERPTAICCTVKPCYSKRTPAYARVRVSVRGTILPAGALRGPSGGTSGLPSVGALYPGLPGARLRPTVAAAASVAACVTVAPRRINVRRRHPPIPINGAYDQYCCTHKGQNWVAAASKRCFPRCRCPYSVVKTYLLTHSWPLIDPSMTHSAHATRAVFWMPLGCRKGVCFG